MLNQEFTYVAGTISNDGDRTLRGLEVSVEFRDPFDQVILREKPERLIGSGDAPLSGGQRRDFQVTLEHVPVEWNRQYPHDQGNRPDFGVKRSHEWLSGGRRMFLIGSTGLSSCI